MKENQKSTSITSDESEKNGTQKEREDNNHQHDYKEPFSKEKNPKQNDEKSGDKGDNSKQENNQNSSDGAE